MSGEGTWRPPLPGLTRIGRYWLECEIGRGGMGAVHLASSRGPDGFKKLLAIKTILPDLEGGDRFVRMLLDEARVASGLTHPNIVQLYDLGTDGSLPYLVMEYVHGESLSSIRRFLGRVPDRLAVDIACQILDALAYANDLRSAGGQPLALVHRDISPQNILLTYDGVPKLVDFGIARAAVRETRTETGVVKGRFHYMPPEQRQGRAVDSRADLYALGLVLYEITVGLHPFERSEGTPPEQVPAPGEQRPDYPAALLAVIRRATEPDREHRFDGAAAMLAALREVAAGLGAPASRQELVTLLREPFAERRRFKEEIVAKGEIGARPTEELGLAPTGLAVSDPHRTRLTESRPSPLPPAAPGFGAAPAPAPAPRARLGRQLLVAGLAAVAALAVGFALFERRAGTARALQAAAAPAPGEPLRVCVRADEHLHLDQQQATWPLVRLIAASLERTPGLAPVHAYRALDEIGWNDEGGLAAQRACADAKVAVDIVVAVQPDGRALLTVDGAQAPLPAGLAAGAKAAVALLAVRLGVPVEAAVPGLDDVSLRRLLEAREFFYFTWGEQRRKHFEAAIREAPELEEPYVLEALTRWWTGDLDRPESRVLRRPPSPSLRTTALLDAVLALEDDHAADAVRLAQLALEDRRYREDPIALYLLGEALFHSGRPAEGAHTLERALAAEPQLLVAAHHLFEHSLGAGDFAYAESLAARWQRVAPTDFHAHEYRAFIALSQGNYADAEARFEALLGREGRSVNEQPLSHVGLIHARALAGDLDGAMLRAEQVSQASDLPSSVMPETVAYALSLWRGDQAGAVRWAERIQRKLGAVPWTSASTHALGYGITLLDLLAGRTDARTRWLGGAAPEKIARRYRFQLLARAVDVMEAHARADAEALGTLAASSGEAMLAHLAWGLKSELEGRFADAAEEFEAALASSGNGELDCLPAAALARVLRAAGDRAGAEVACKRVLTPFVPRPYCIVMWESCGKSAAR